MSSDSPHVPGLGPDDGDEESDFDLDAVMSLLVDRRRRYLLYHLRDEGNATVDDLADRIVHWEDDTDRGTRKRVKAGLYHKHIPLLEEMDVVRAEDDQLELRDVDDLLAEYLDLAAEQERPL